MKIKLSKSQWELIGKRTGWNKIALKNISLRIGKGKYGGEIATLSAREPGKIQVTSFTENGVPSGHENYLSFEEALSDQMRWTKVEHPVAILAKNNYDNAFYAWEEATIDHPNADELMAFPYAYASPLRPMSGISIDGKTSLDKSKRIGLLYRDNPLPIDKLESLSLIPITPEAIKSFASDYVQLKMK